MLHSPRKSLVTQALRLLAATACILLIPLGSAPAATSTTTLSFSNIPLFLGLAQQSNLIMAIDNSGSTDWEISVASYNGEMWWNNGTETSCSTVGFTGCSAVLSGSSYVNKSASNTTFNVNPSGNGFGSGFGYAYVVPNGIQSDYAMPPLPSLAFARSANYNSAYFDATKSYTPWGKYDGTSYANASVTAAPDDPSGASTAQTFNLTNDQAGTSSGSVPAGESALACGSIGVAAGYTATAFQGGQTNWTSHVRTGMTIPAGTCVWTPKSTVGNGTPTTQNGTCTGSGNGSGACKGKGTAGSCNFANPPAVPAGPVNNSTQTQTISFSTCSGLGTTSVKATWTITTTPIVTTTSNVWALADQAVQVGVNGSNLVLNSTHDPAAKSTIADGDEVSIRYYAPTFWLPHSTASPYTSFISGKLLLTGKGPDGSAMDGYEIKSGNFTDPTEYTKAIQNYANWFSYYRKRILALKNGISQTFNSLTTPLMLYAFPIGSYNSLSTSSNLMLDSKTPGSLQTFYTSILNLVASGGTPDREAIRAIGKQYRRTDANRPITASCQKNFGFLFTDGYANPLAGSVTYTGASSGDVDGSTATAFKNFGASNNPYKDGATGVAYTMADETMYDFVGPLISTGVNGFTDSSGNPTTNVPIDATCDRSTTPPSPPSSAPWTDCNNVLHMDFYGVILNTIGFTYDGTANAYKNAYTTTPTWPSSTALSGQSPAQADDLFHAAVNGRGQLLNATTPDAIRTQLQTILQAIAKQNGSESSIAINTDSIQSTSAIFQASFYNADWSGDVKRFALGSGGTLGASADWSAQTLLDSAVPNNRVVLSYDPASYSGTPFRWAKLGANQQTLLNLDTTNSPATVDAYGSQRVDYLRGIRTQEASNATPRFHTRGHVLGDIVDSSPYFVGPPSASYADSSYVTFATSYASRKPMVYVGANDGMLHGFNADTTGNGGGNELLAYVPSTAYGQLTGTTYSPGLASLTGVVYQHQFFVDGSPTVADAKVNGSWKTVLVGSVGQGGQGVFALDVTDPAQFTEANAKTVVMWEFTDADDPDLGNTFSQPSIVKMANGQWAAIIGNGYNNAATAGGADSNVVSTANTGKGALFVLLLSGPSGTNTTGSRWKLGTDYFKIYAGASTTSVPNGLATPAAVDVNGDGVVDYIYAGDLLGRLWRFNVKDSSTSNWKVAYNGNPVFTAHDTTGGTQPITERPEVGFNTLASSPNSTVQPQLIVYFGTGSYIATTDSATSGQPTQTFYAIFDRFDDLVTTSLTAPTKPPTRDLNGGGTYNMARQTINGEVTAAGGTCSASSGDCFRVTSTYTVSDSNQGWYLDLVNTATGANNGERQVTTPVLRGSTIIFTTLIPSASSCSGGGSGWLMELSAASGAALPTPPFDVDHNGKLDTTGSTDKVTYNSNATVASGMRSSIGFLSRPSIIQVDNKNETKYLGGSQGKISTVAESSSLRSGRITWREITP